MTLGVNRSALNAVSRGEIRESVGGDRAPLSLTLVGFGFADAVVSHPSKIWSRLQSQCINGRYLVEKESPFTFHNMTRVCYRGLPLSLATSTLSLGLITLGADKIRETIQSHTSLSSTSSGLAASALAGTVATAVTLPIDAMRTKMVQCATRNTLDNKITMPSTLALMRGLLDDVRRRGANTTLKEVASFMFKKELPYSLARTVSVFMIINRVTELVTATPVTSRYPGFFDANDSGREASDSPKESSPRKPGR